MNWGGNVVTSVENASSNSKWGVQSSWFCKECCVVMQTSSQMIAWAWSWFLSCSWVCWFLHWMCVDGWCSSVLLPWLGGVDQLYFCVFHSLNARWVTQYLLWVDEEILLNLCHSPPGVWAHGDYCKINPKTGGIVMLGRRYSVLLGVLGGKKVLKFAVSMCILLLGVKCTWFCHPC